MTLRNRLWEIYLILLGAALIGFDRSGLADSRRLKIMGKNRIEITCPCCQAKLLVDASTGLVIHSEAKKATYSFDDALKKEQERKSRSDALFAKAVEDEKRRHDSLEDRFQEALRSKDELDEPPPRPFDLD